MTFSNRNVAYVLSGQDPTQAERPAVERIFGIGIKDRG